MSIKRYTISGLHPHIIEDKNGFMVYYEDYARTKADVGELADALILASEVGIKMADEVTRLKTLTVEMDKTINISQAGCRELKTEVERLTFDPLSYLDDQGEWMPRHTHLAAVEILKAEVERLRKAGDAMHRAIKVSDPFLDWAIECWLAAKEGKQGV